MTKIYIAECELGKGLFAAKDFKKGEYILTFEGPLISFEQVAAKGEFEGNPLQIDYNLYIDLQDPSRSANHSCNPNSGIIKANILIAIKDIFIKQGNMAAIRKK
ncbi:MAG: SET domain-containing protein [Deltaproteobacteria bacterium]|nr:SET domain-containing protein [Deltaproteobacteria bacterium]